MDKSFLLTLLPISFVLGGSRGGESNITVLGCVCGDCKDLKMVPSSQSENILKYMSVKRNI